jgi:hypothetical protein
MTQVIRIRLLAFGHALRAAARLGDRTRMTDLESVALAEADRANVPFEMASFFLSASEAWYVLPDFAVATTRLERLEALTRTHQFHELAARAETLRDQLRTARTPVSVPATAEPPEWGDEVAVGIGRLAGLAG